MWKKAEEILNTPGLILPAAGNKLAQQVANTDASSSKDITPPHFVFSKKLGATVEVRCNCGIFKSTPNICQHSLAAAETMGILKDYLDWVQKTKAKGLNLSTLIANDIPKSSGKKVAHLVEKVHLKVRKEVTMEESGLTVNPPVSLESCTSTTNEESPYLTAAIHLCQQFAPPFNVPPPFSSPIVPSSGISYRDQSSFNSPYPSYNYWNISSSLVPTLPSCDLPVFGLKHLKGTRICSCYGCGNPIRTDLSYVPPPPHDIVVTYKERHYYKDPGDALDIN